MAQEQPVDLTDNQFPDAAPGEFPDSAGTNLGGIATARPVATALLFWMDDTD